MFVASYYVSTYDGKQKIEQTLNIKKQLNKKPIIKYEKKVNGKHIKTTPVKKKK